MAKKKKKEDFNEVRKVKFKNMSTGEQVFVICNFIILTLFVFFTMFPVLNTLAISLNEGSDAISGGIYLLPRKFTWNNYEAVVKMNNIIPAARTTLLRTIIATIVHLLTTSLLAYVLSRKDFLFAKPISILYVITMYVNGGLIPTLLVYKELGFMNSFWVYIIPGMVSAFNMIVIRTYMNGLPASLFEAAEVDGAGHMKIFFRIVLPLCKPVLATIALFIAVYQWNAWFDTMIYNKLNKSLSTLQYELMKMLAAVMNTTGNLADAQHSSSQLTQKTLRAAVTIATSLPIIMIYPFLQRYFVTGLTIGGIKE